MRPVFVFVGLGLCGCFSDAGGGSGGDASTGSGDSATTADSCDAADSVCVAAAPTGWSGPAALYIGPGGPVPPPCPPGYDGQPVIASSGLTVAPGSCGCQCGPAQGLGCEPPIVSIAGNSTCGGAVTTEQLTPGDCVDINLAAVWMRLGPISTNGGLCEASPIEDFPEPIWDTTAQLCPGTSDRGGCPGTDICVPIAGGAFGSRPCIFAEGDLPCPAGPYAMRTVYRLGTDDTRRCMGCTCGPPEGTCNADVEYWNNPSCPGASEGVAAAGACTAVGDLDSIRLVAEPQPGVATCTAAEVQFVGEAVEGPPITVCCAP